jgi:hypothetical protein
MVISVRRAKGLRAKSLATVVHAVHHSLPHQNFQSVRLQNV